ncbi:hypothetical protein [Nocardioides limicola]|uniref:hypothetical protein n=1 Tax=Nocardioides limicola TaxID=2803368 RepID=UPI00193B344D|nr:hypothetical protein [Nocardioides sp. DJM-14]
MTRRLVQLVASCLVLGLGVSLLLDARLGSDGYSTLLSGLTKATGASFLLVSLAVGLPLIGIAWLRGRPPGIGTLAQAVLVGLTVNTAWPLMPSPESLPWRGVELVAAFVVLAVGVAGYLAVDLGAGPTEVIAQAFDPPVPFRWGYTTVQATGMVVGWLCGADVGVGTVMVVVGLGYAVSRLIPPLTPAATSAAPPPATPPPALGRAGTP